MHYVIIRDEGAMTVIPDSKEVRDFLTLSYRAMNKANGRTTFENLKADMFSPCVVGDGVAGLRSYQGFWRSLKDQLEKDGHSVTVKDERENLVGNPNLLQACVGLRSFQKPWLLAALMDGNSGLIGAVTRFGKCLHPDTEILMYDGSLRKVRDVVVGDLVMGPDSLPRTVSSVCSGEDEMYRITPNKGDAWECTQDHILSLRSSSGDVKHVTVTDYLGWSSDLKRTHKQYYASVSFDKWEFAPVCSSSPLTGFRVEAVGIGPYAGFSLTEEDARFVMGNFAVTHNSYGMSGLCRAFPNARTVVIAPGVSLCKQIFDHLAETLPHRDVRGIYTGSKHKIQGPDITVCSMDSMDKMDTEDTDMLIVDECHAVVSEERLPKLAAFAKARKYGFGATLTGRFDKKDRLIEGLIGPVLTNVSYKEGVALGAVSPLKVMMVKIPFSKDTIPGNRVERDVVYKRLLHQSSKAAKLVKQLVDEIIPADWQTMAFISNEKQAEFYMQHAFPPHGTIAMAKRMKDKERDAITAQIASGELVRVLASNIYVQGITFPDLKVVINLAGGGANTTAIQKPGRLLQCRPGKNYGVMIDFIFECRDAETDNRQHPPYQGIVGESWARHKAYTEIGYDVVFVDRAEQAHDIMKGAYNE